MCFLLFFFNDTATTEIYTLSLHDALPISAQALIAAARGKGPVLVSSGWVIDFWYPHGEICGMIGAGALARAIDRKSTRLNSSHLVISYAVFCLKKKKIICRHVSYHDTAKN